MDYSFINLILLIIIITVILFVSIVIISYYYHICSYVDSFTEKAKALIPSLYSDDNHDITYNESYNFDNIYDDSFSEDLSVFLANITRSAYNISKDSPSYLPDYLKLVDTIGNNGYIIKVINPDTKHNIYIITYRGTTSVNDLLTDIDSIQTNFIGIDDKINHNLKVHRGFYNYWIESKDDILNFTKKINSNDIVLITGHSLGCASAVFTALSISSMIKSIYIKLYLFAPPRIGNDKFIDLMNKNISNNWAIINESDIVPYLPPVTLPTVGNNWIYDNWPNRILINIQYGSILLNHKLSSYMCSFDQNLCLYDDLKWNRKYIKIKIDK